MYRHRRNLQITAMIPEAMSGQHCCREVGADCKHTAYQGLIATSTEEEEGIYKLQHLNRSMTTVGLPEPAVIPV